ncbi:MAG: spore germination protein, partial [Lachnospiraceae bacterium]|nr:spore germination protein [Lachnospiraceae bacterium]
ELSEAFRILKYGMIFLCGFFGFYGFVTGWLLLIIHLAGLKSFGIPYLMPFAAGSRDGISLWSDGVFRAPARRMKHRPVYTRRNARTRMRVKAQSEEEKDNVLR